jgi:hypothetical protein
MILAIGLVMQIAGIAAALFFAYRIGYCDGRLREMRYHNEFLRCLRLSQSDDPVEVERGVEEWQLFLMMQGEP